MKDLNQGPPDWDKLAQSIKDEEAVLVLGPDAVPFYPALTGEGIPQSQHTENIAESFSKLSRKRVKDKLQKGQIQHFYERDNLFQFSDAAAKQNAMKQIREAARDRAWLPDAELLRQIVQMPFAVVLSLNPDKYLYEAFQQHGLNCQFDFFTTKSKPDNPNLQRPSSNNPLLYNLGGSVQDRLDSVVLDYFDLFEFLKSLLQDHNIPEGLVEKLRNADRYILLGFDLERWYFQLFLQYINKLDSNFDNSKQSYPIFSHVSEGSTDFVVRQFNIQHVAASRNDFERLFDACRTRGILRPIVEASSPLEKQFRILMAQGHFDQVFELLYQHSPENVRQIDIPQWQGRYNQLKDMETNCTISSADALVERNRIRYALLTYASQLSKA